MAAPVLRLVGPDGARDIAGHLPVSRPALWGVSSRAIPRRPGDPLLHLHADLQALGLGPKSVAIYARRIRKADDWLQEQGSSLAKASGPLIARYADTLPRAWSTRKELRAACKWYWIIVKRKNPPLAVIRVPPKPTMVCKALEDEDALILAKVARQAPYPEGLVLGLGLYQAMRREEIATLPWAAFSRMHTARPAVTVIGKGEKQRTIPLHPELLDKLIGLEHSGLYVFPGRFGGHVAPATVWSWIRRLGAEAGLPDLSPHQLRHTCLASQNDNGKDLRAVQRFAGHSRPETTSGYTRTTEDALYDSMMSIDYFGERRRRGRRSTQGAGQPSLFDGADDEDDDSA